MTAIMELMFKSFEKKKALIQIMISVKVLSAGLLGCIAHRSRPTYIEIRRWHSSNKALNRETEQSMSRRFNALINFYEIIITTETSLKVISNYRWRFDNTYVFS